MFSRRYSLYLKFFFPGFFFYKTNDFTQLFKQGPGGEKKHFQGFKESLDQVYGV